MRRATLLSVILVALATTLLVGGAALAASLRGTEGQDRLVGTGDPDVLSGLGGADVLGGLGATDELRGGAGDDDVYGDRCYAPHDGPDCNADSPLSSPGDDVLRGGGGRDEVFGGEGDDTIYGGKDGDSLQGDPGNDTAGNDTIYGGPDDAADQLWGWGGDDKLYGGPNPSADAAPYTKEYFYGGGGSDELWGGPGPDVLDPGLGADTVRWGPNRDRMRARPDGQVDRISCGEGKDAVRYEEGVDEVDVDCEVQLPFE